ncbi:ABC transporter permease [Rhizosphaericola mali]|uniref:ABC transporter permease n=1 Tax=Rhizosphaericola mali TaxID=2545455 RepID=A0A5P2GGB4_9BACT|nr:ABC transporter permease [Rhizosphaericola mali]QES90771.1 ABC transporter permease [Rhizosphaericola mali]
MNKITLIAQREFSFRVKKKTFLITTILLPILISGLYALMIYFSVKGGDKKLNIAILDQSEFFTNGDSNLKNSKNFSVFIQKGDTAVGNKLLRTEAIDGYIIWNDGLDSLNKAKLISSKSIGLQDKSAISSYLNNIVRNERIRKLASGPQVLQLMDKEVDLNYATLDKGEDSMMKSGVSYGVGFASGFLIYFVLIIYGMSVMRGVMEEKVSRIAEVMISSVKPFQLMMGKIIGIGAVGLLQFLIWIVLTIVLRLILMPMFFPGISSNIQNAAGGQEGIGAMMHGLSTINFPVIITFFLIYFIGGYFLYASLFAAVGSAVNEDPQDAQSFTFPIMMPIIFGFVLLTRAINDPHSSVAVFGSLFPLTSPIVMLGRIAQGVPDAVPYWQLALSIALLILGFLFTTWLAGKVYRTGILMYGKKPTWKELIKWAKQK